MFHHWRWCNRRNLPQTELRSKTSLIQILPPHPIRPRVSQIGVHELSKGTASEGMKNESSSSNSHINNTLSLLKVSQADVLKASKDGINANTKNHKLGKGNASESVKNANTKNECNSSHMSLQAMHNILSLLKVNQTSVLKASKDSVELRMIDYTYVRYVTK
ncbi:hypothetical protein FA15DRAFT_710031 [Coprinopsis marcescibilis]|uniref:Uncharacterized protein n=1 Tax=Coprinopsis marcescibilis TaxID=230819 RepID=A0A5C3KE36_COPMA|nr:hypothetical protein FA15DRAFT_710031 [Coprinopsis marcescibilis]